MNRVPDASWIELKAAFVNDLEKRFGGGDVLQAAGGWTACSHSDWPASGSPKAPLCPAAQTGSKVDAASAGPLQAPGRQTVAGHTKETLAIMTHAGCAVPVCVFKNATACRSVLVLQLAARLDP